VQHVWETIELHKTLWWGDLKSKRPIGRHRRRWQGNIKLNLKKKKMGEVGMDWIDLAQDRDRWRALVNEVINLRVPYNVGHILTSGGPVSFSDAA